MASDLIRPDLILCENSQKRKSSPDLWKESLPDSGNPRENSVEQVDNTHRPGPESDPGNLNGTFPFWI